MDFNSLGSGSPFYVLTKGAKPILQIGTVKSKTAPQAKYQNGTNGYNAANIQQVINIIATIEGKDENFPEIPLNVEVAQSGDKIFSGSQTAMLAVVENLMQMSKKALEQVEYHKTMLTEGDKILEMLNPKYADEKKQAKTISELEKNYAEMSKKFAKLETDNAQIIAMLKKMSEKSTKNDK